MTTVSTLITRSLRLLSQVNSGETPTTNELSDGLIDLNAMLDSWRNERLMCYATQEEAFTVVNGTNSYTIGPSGSLNTTRPVEVIAAYARANNYDYPMRMIDAKSWASIVAKASQANWPTHCFYDPTMTTGTLYVWPTPNNSTTSIRLVTRVPVAAFSATSDSISLPPGWEQALAYNLAVQIAPQYETQPAPSVVQEAVASKAAIRRLNSRAPTAYKEVGVLLGNRRSNIITDEP